MTQTLSEGAKMVGGEQFVLGWEEWAGLPLLGLPSLKAKIDTGAKTSALHAQSIEPIDDAGVASVRFVVQPVPRRPSISVVCVAAIHDERIVTSSNGEPEQRYVIATQLEVGDRRWPIELTLTNRESMRFRMLIGRQAMGPGIIVEPSTAFCQPRRSHKVYRPAPPPR